MQDETPKANPQLDAARFGLAEQVRNIHAICVPSGLTRAQILHPDFFGAIAAKLRSYDHIEVNCDDDTLYAELLVVGAERTHAFVRVLKWEDLRELDASKEAPTQTVATVDGYEIGNRGQHLKWCVIRKSDSTVIREKEKTEIAAHAWLAEYLRIAA